MPVVKHDEPPASQASVTGSIHISGFCFMPGHTHGVIAVEHDVDAGAQERGHDADVLVGVLRRRAVVDQRIGLQGDERVEVVRAEDADGIAAAERTDVDADLLGVADADADELELGVVEDLVQHELADEAGPPDDDALAHVTTSPLPVTSGRSSAVTSPGFAPTTAGTELTSRIAVALRPAVLWSPSVPSSWRSSV